MTRVIATLAAFGLWSTHIQAADIGRVELRLATPLTSYDTARQSQFELRVIAPFIVNGRVVFPYGTIIGGTVVRRTKVGIGFVHERARLQLSFQYYQLPDEQRFPFEAKLLQIDNAREVVSPTGEIKGIRAANGPEHLLKGMWYRPTFTLVRRTVLGLTGVSGRIWTGYSMGLVGGMALFLLRCTVFQLPEPEIELPPGTEMAITVTSLPEGAPSSDLPVTADVSKDMAELLSDQPFTLGTRTAKPARDIINVAFLGTREDLVQAFHAAGWSEAAPVSARSLSRGYHAFTTQSGDQTAPASKLTYGGAEPEVIFQKSFNTLAKRHHIRIWRVTSAGQELWMGAATHDIGVGFDPGTMLFTHKIEPAVDLEREKVVNDLAFAGCADPAFYVNRQKAAQTPNGDSGILTDGRLATLKLHRCAGLKLDLESFHRPAPKPLMVRLARRVILEGKQYLFRDNAYYWSYRALTWRGQPRRAAPKPPLMVDDIRPAAGNSLQEEKL